VVNALSCVGVNADICEVDKALTCAVDITLKLVAEKACIWADDKLPNAEASSAVTCVVVRLAICLAVKLANWLAVYPETSVPAPKEEPLPEPALKLFDTEVTIFSP
jgi:hypothetical protein